MLAPTLRKSTRERIEEAERERQLIQQVRVLLLANEEQASSSAAASTLPQGRCTRVKQPGPVCVRQPDVLLWLHHVMLPYTARRSRML